MSSVSVIHCMASVYAATVYLPFIKWYVNAFNQLYITNKTERFSFKSGRAMQIAKLIKED